jgi:hypothetical protein
MKEAQGKRKYRGQNLPLLFAALKYSTGERHGALYRSGLICDVERIFACDEHRVAKVQPMLLAAIAYLTW